MAATTTATTSPSKSVAVRSNTQGQMGARKLQTPNKSVGARSPTQGKMSGATSTAVLPRRPLSWHISPSCGIPWLVVLLLMALAIVGVFYGPGQAGTILAVCVADASLGAHMHRIVVGGGPMWVQTLLFPFARTGTIWSEEGVIWTLPGISRTGGLCIWTALRDLGLSPSSLLDAGIAPWTTTLSRVATHRLPRVLPVWYSTAGRIGHVSATHFPGSRYGLPLALMHTRPWASQEDFPKSEHAPRSSFLSAPIAALGGVKATLTELVTEFESPNLGKFWQANTYTGFSVARKLNFSHQIGDHTITTTRHSEFERHYPQRNHVITNPDTFEDSLSTVVFYESTGALSHEVAATYSQRPWLSSRSNRVPALEFGELGGLMEGATTKDALKMAQETVGGVRFMGSRGDRVIMGWQAEDRPRGLGLSAFAQSASRLVDYREVCFRLFARYYSAIAVEQYRAWAGTLPPLDYRGVNVTFGPRRRGANAALTFIHAGPPVALPPAPMLNPEAPMWTDAAQIGLKTGTKQFIDASDMSEDELIELLSAMDPTDVANVPRLQYGPIEHRRRFRQPCTRYYFPSGVTEIFIHTGLDAGKYDAAAQARIAASVHGPPRATDIATVIRLLTVRHGAGQAAIFGSEMALYRAGVKHSDQIPGRFDGASRHEYPGSDGNWELHLPQTYTGMAYFDTFMAPGAVPIEVDGWLNLTGSELLNNAAIVTHARYVSLNWASYAQSMYGRNWRHRPAQEPDRRIKQWTNILSRTFNFDKVTDWSTTHANAMAIQYGYAPSVSVRSTEAGWIRPYWADWVTPVFTNHYLELWAMEFIPTFQLLPFFDPELGSSHTPWPTDRPRPLMARESFNGQVLLGRDSPSFAPQAWKQSGGPQYAAQFYAAAGAGSGWRYSGNELAFNLMRMTQERVDRFRNAPAAMAPVWMQAAGSPFADFLLPGTINSWNFATNVSYDWGVQLGNAPAGLSYTTQLNRWRELANQEPHNSLMVNYIHPHKDRRQLETLLDYSTVILEKGNTYSGLVLVKHLMPNYELDERFSPRAMDYQKLPVALPEAGPSFSVPDGTRVAAARAPFGTSAAKFTNRARVEPRLEYKAKNPELLEDLPPMDDHQVSARQDGIHLDAPGDKNERAIELDRPIYMEGAESGYDYDLEQERAVELDNDLREFLQEQALKQAHLRKEQLERDARLARSQKPTTPYRRRERQPRFSPELRERAAIARNAVAAASSSHSASQVQPFEAAPPPQLTAVPPGHSYTVPFKGRFPIRPAGPVEPNDSEAGAAQARALLLGAQATQLAEPAPTQGELNDTDHVSSLVREPLPEDKYANLYPVLPKGKRVTFSPPPILRAPLDHRVAYPPAGPLRYDTSRPPTTDWDGLPVASVAGQPLEQARVRTDSANRLAAAAEAIRDPENSSGTLAI